MADDNADPLPYVIIFAILFLVAIGVLTWTLDIWYKSNQCIIYPNIWCSDTWTCNTQCPEAKNECFHNPGTTGLASCLFGPNAPGATVCFASEVDPNQPLCDCPEGMQQQNLNCMSGCATSLSNVKDTTPCCCTPNAKGCPYTEETLPASCRPTQ